MTLPGVSLEHSGKTAVVTFHETTMNRRFVAWLESVVGWLEQEPSILAVVFTGTRNVFITGADLAEVRQLRARAAVEDFLRIPHILMERIFGMEKLTGAAINGRCLGGGLELALVCDFRVAADVPSSYLGLPEVRLGLVPALGGAARILRVVGERAAQHLLYSGELITAAQALAIGLVDEIITPGLVLRRTLDRCAEVLQNSPVAMGMLKRMIINDAERTRFANDLRRAATGFITCCLHGDKDERIDALRREAVTNFRRATNAAEETVHQ